MAKTVNFNEKLDYADNPVLVVDTINVEVKTDAETVLLLIECFSEGDDMKSISKAINLLFDPKDVKKICSLKKNGKKLSAKSLIEIVKAAMDLAVGENDMGEQ